MVRAVTVYCSSSNRIADSYMEAGHQLGKAIASQGWTLVYGGNHVGLMGQVADGARAGGGKVVGITPQVLVDHGLSDPACDELVVTPGMRERKALLEERGDAFLALPGGLGTLEEIFEIIVGKQLGYHRKPIVLLNLERYYEPLLAMIEHGIEHHFIKTEYRSLYRVADSVETAINHLSEVECEKQSPH